MSKISKARNGNLGRAFKINYEELKISMRYEDIFYEEYLRPECEKLGLDISFNGKFVILTPKELV